MTVGAQRTTNAGGRTVAEPIDEPGPTAATADDRLDAALFAEAYPALRRLAAVVAPLDLDPDDLLQEAVARTLRAGPLHRLDHPVAYLRQTMVHLASNHNRSKGRERRANGRHEATHDADPPTDYPSDLAVLDHLDAEDRAAVYLADVERLPFDEVARILGITAVAARARTSRARRRLRTALAEGGAR